MPIELKVTPETIKYVEQRERVLNGEEQPRYIFQKLSLAEASRINRGLLTRGLILVYWDSPELQFKLAESFMPIKMEKFSLRVSKAEYTAMERNPMMKRLLNSYSPKRGEVSKLEQSVEDFCQMLAKLHLRGVQKELRTLPEEQLSFLLKLNGLSRNAGELEVKTGSAAERR